MDGWLVRIKAEGEIEILLDQDILPIFQQFMMHVTLGANIDALSVVMTKREKSRDHGLSCVKKTVSVSEAVEETFQ